MRIEPPRASGPAVQETPKSAIVFGKRLPDSVSTVGAAHIVLPSLELGQEVEALVVDELADGRLVLDIGGALVEGNDPGSLGIGQRLRLRVDLLEPQILLHIVDQELPLEAEVARLLRQRLPVADQDSLGGLQATLDLRSLVDEGGSASLWTEKRKTFLRKLFNAQETMTSERLMQIVQDGGLHYEMKLLRAVAAHDPNLANIADEDLKGLLLGVLKELDLKAAPGESRQAVADQLYHLEGRQAANLLAQLEGHAFQLQVPIFTGAGFTDVAVSIEGDGGGKGEGSKKKSGEYNILFALELAEFGRIRVDARLRTGSVTAVFYVDAEESLKRIDMELPRLRESLRAVGFREVLLAARPLRNMVQERELKFTALALGMPADIRLLNVKV
jgi:hypothetical protein